MINETDPVALAYRRLAMAAIKQAALEYKSTLLNPDYWSCSLPGLRNELIAKAERINGWFYSSEFALYAPDIDPEYFTKLLNEDIKTILRLKTLPYLCKRIRRREYWVIDANDWETPLSKLRDWESASAAAAARCGLSPRIYRQAVLRMSDYHLCPVDGANCDSRWCEHRNGRHGCPVHVERGARCR